MRRLRFTIATSCLLLGTTTLTSANATEPPEIVDFFVQPSSGNLTHLSPALAADSAGNFVLAWLATEGVDRPQGIVASLFDKNGVKLRGPLPVSAGLAGNFYPPVVARAAGGAWVVAWVRVEFGPPSRYYLEMRRFRPGGLPAGPVVRVNSDPSILAQSPALAIDALGRVAVAWESHRPPFTGGSIQLRRYGPFGRAIGPEQPVTVSSGNFVSNPALAFGTDGALLITWRRWELPGDIHVVAGLLPRPSDPVVPPSQVSEEASHFGTVPRLAADPRGGFLVVWENCERPTQDGQPGPCTVRAKRLGPRAEIESSELHLSDVDGREVFSLALALDRRGTLAAAWTSAGITGTPDDNFQVKLQLFGEDGTAASEPATFDAEDALWLPTLAAAGDAFALVYEETGIGPDGLIGKLARTVEEDAANEEAF